ncbi:unnamed protein product [Prunus armeniaca]|uniref:Uncharacterized protein n=1 Tax=Prunus armeniaca TaxID=36596 RepID=A0A6J5X4L8_PRUAR|nr:unnamed protein product [Prunus armeniaca]
MAEMDTQKERIWDLLSFGGVGFWGWRFGLGFWALKWERGRGRDGYFGGGMIVLAMAILLWDFEILRLRG